MLKQHQLTVIIHRQVSWRRHHVWHASPGTQHHHTTAPFLGAVAAAGLWCECGTPSVTSILNKYHFYCMIKQLLSLNILSLSHTHMRKQKHSERERDNEHTWDGEAVIYIENNAGLITPVSMGKHPLIRWFALHHCQHTHCHTLKHSLNYQLNPMKYQLQQTVFHGLSWTVIHTPIYV